MRTKNDISALPVKEQEELAFKKVMRVVNISETSSVKMRTKLNDAGFDSQVVEGTINKAMEYSLIDDMRYANCLVRTALSNHKGLEKVEYELESLGISLNQVDAYNDYLEAGEMSQIDMALEVLRRYPPKAKNKRDGAYRKLRSKGYSDDIASSAASKWISEILGR